MPCAPEGVSSGVWSEYWWQEPRLHRLEVSPCLELPGAEARWVQMLTSSAHSLALQGEWWDGGGGSKPGLLHYRYLVTFSPLMDTQDDPQAIIIWDILTGQKKRGFHCESSAHWPIFK